MQAVILTGGFGTRLREVVSGVPKGMADVGGQPFLEYQVRFLQANGVKEVVFCLGYLADQIKEYFGDGLSLGLRVRYSVEPKPLGTAGAIKYAEKLLDPWFIVLNGDTYVDANVAEVVNFHLQTGASLTLLLVSIGDTAAYGRVEIDSYGKIVGFREKGLAGPGLINAGLYVMEKELLKYIPEGQTYSLEKEFLPGLLRDGISVYGFIHHGYFIDIGTPENYARAQEELPRRFGW